MKNKESVSDFYDRHGKEEEGKQFFNVHRVEEFATITLPPNRRDFYKITLTTRADGILSAADTLIPIKDNALTFSNPLIPYSWERRSGIEKGYFCLFTEEFVNPGMKTGNLAKSPLFKAGGNRVLFPDSSAMTILTGIFEQMLREILATYINKYDLLRSYIQIIMHEALKIQPPESYYQPADSSARISDEFLELLDRQFPIASPRHTLVLKNAHAFAGRLSVHTNHLNRALRKATGKTTTELISERIVRESKALLLHSNWNIAEIGYCMGFEHASNFNIFFKKQTGLTPNQFRSQSRILS